MLKYIYSEASLIGQSKGVCVCALLCPLCGKILIQDIGISNVTLDVTFCVADILLIVSSTVALLLPHSALLFPFLFCFAETLMRCITHTQRETGTGTESGAEVVEPIFICGTLCP